MTDLNQTSLPGPVFETGPGWGARLKKWLTLNFSRKILPVLAILIFLTGVSKLSNQPQNNQSANNELGQFSNQLVTAQIGIVIEKGDGIIKASRRALDRYLEKYPELSKNLSPVQRLHIDNFFKEKFSEQQLEAGREISFSENDLQQAIDGALDLSPHQLQQLEKYLK